MSAPAAPAASPQFYIADGVHRAVAARENGLLLVPARLVVQGQRDQFIDVSLDQLHSPKASISRRVTSRRNYPAWKRRSPPPRDGPPSHVLKCSRWERRV